MKRSYGSPLRPIRRHIGKRVDSFLRRSVFRALVPELEVLNARVTEDLGEQIAQVRKEIAQLRSISAAAVDGVPDLRRELLRVRDTESYRQSLQVAEPLVSVRIATFNRSKMLLERAIPSVLAQSYPNFELIVVGDGCTDDTERCISQLRDRRVRFFNLPHRSMYPSDPACRWMVAGIPAMNLGAQMARGQWIAPLDDDDEFSVDHIEVLLRAALQEEAELVYGRMKRILPPYTDLELGSYPPEKGQFGFQASVYMTALRFFEYDLKAWTLSEPGDWNLCRRMLEAGVRIGWVQQVVTTLYPSGVDPNGLSTRD